MEREKVSQLIHIAEPQVTRVMAENGATILDTQIVEGWKKEIMQEDDTMRVVRKLR
jgi:hypothetical protein